MHRNAVIELLEEGQISIPVVFLDYYDALGIDEKDMMLILHIHRFIQQGKTFPTPEQLAKKMTFTMKSCQEALSRLLKRGVLKIEKKEDEAGIMYESFSLRPLYEKIVAYLEAEFEQPNLPNKNIGSLYTLFENEFGRPLSPIEGETLAMWVDKDQYSYELIQTALREAVLSGKLNLRYIDRILFEWQRNGVRTAEAALVYSEKFRQKRGAGNIQAAKSAPPYPDYNWLESE